MRNAPLNGSGHAVHVDFLDCCPEPVGSWGTDHAAFTHVALAYRFGRDGVGCSGGDGAVPSLVARATERDREALRTSFPALKRAFEHEHGAICRSYFARCVFAAAVLTKKDEICVVIGDDIPDGCDDLIDLLRRCQQVGYMAWHRLAQYDRRLCQNMVFSVVDELLRRLDRRARATERRQSGRGAGADPLDALSKHLDEAEDFMLRCAARRAQIRYLKGMLIGTIVVGGLLALLALGASYADGLSDIGSHLVIVATAGAVGAFVSVLARMTSGTFRMNLPTLSYEMRSTDLWLMGGLRPLIGLIFAIAAYVLVMSALVPVQPRDADAEIFLYAAVGFLAGFSERFAQDVFVRSGQGLAGVMGDSPMSGPSAGLAPPPGAEPASDARRRLRSTGR